MRVPNIPYADSTGLPQYKMMLQQIDSILVDSQDKSTSSYSLNQRLSQIIIGDYTGDTTLTDIGSKN